MNIMPQLQLEPVTLNLSNIINIQGMIRQAVIEDDENAARWLDKHLEGTPPSYRLAALACAQMLMNIRRRFESP